MTPEIALPLVTAGHSSVLVEGAPRIAVDPWRWREGPCDVVLVTHGHADHACSDDLVAATHERSRVLAPRSEERRLRELFGRRAEFLAEGDERGGAGWSVRALPHEGPPRARGFHPRGAGLSWLLETAGARVLLLGDSTALPAHEGLAPDVALFAVGGFTVMDPEEAAEAAARVRAKLSVALAWGDLVGKFATARRFVDLCTAAGIAAVPVHGRNAHP